MGMEKGWEPFPPRETAESEYNGRTRQTLKLKAANKKRGLSLADLRYVVNEATQREIQEMAQVRVTVGWHGQIQTIEVEG